MTQDWHRGWTPHVLARSVLLSAELRKTIRKQAIFRRSRRTLYVLVGLGILAPIVGFFILYQIVSVPNPQAVAATLNQPITIYYADNSVMDTIGTGENGHQLIQTSDLPNLQPAVHAVEAAEDSTFQTNAGVDLKAILRTAYNQASGGTGGASTITQEYIKQATNPGYLGSLPIKTKIAEMVSAYKMSRTVSKPVVMTSYLNIVYFGRGAYGIGAAAKTYFNESSPTQLTDPQAAFLAGLIQSPGRANSTSYQTLRYTYVLGQMAKDGWLQAGEQDAPMPTLQAAPTGASSMPWDRQLIAKQVEDELAANKLDMDTLQRMGAKVYTTIQPGAQQDAEQSVQSVMAKDSAFTNGGPMNFGGRPVTVDGRQIKATEDAALVSVDPTTGGIIAWYGGNDPNATQYDMADTPHQPGSSFKPYVFTSALENDPSQEGLNAIYDGSNSLTIAGHVVHNSEGEGNGPVTVKTAMTQSINTVFYAMGVNTGVNNVRATAFQAGIPETMKNTSGSGPSMVPSLIDPDGKTVAGGISIGQYPVRPRDQAQGYATLANYGNYIPTHFITKVLDQTGATLYQFNIPAKPAFGDEPTSNSIAHTVIDSMSDVASSDQIPLAGNRPVAAKTGTQGYNDPATNQPLNGWDSDAWMVGFTPSVVTSVWIGHYDRTAPIFGSGNNPEANGGKGAYVMFGREDPGVIWRGYMNAVLGNSPVQQFANYTDINGTWNFMTNQAVTTTQSQPPSTPVSTPPNPLGGGPGPGGGGGKHSTPPRPPTSTSGSPPTSCRPGRPKCRPGG
jgi:membrane peptidoglycan carboxypeptidase